MAVQLVLKPQVPPAGVAQVQVAAEVQIAAVVLPAWDHGLPSC